MKNKLEEMKAKMAEMQAQMDELQSEMDEMENEIDEVESEVDMDDEIDSGKFVFTRTELTNFVLDMHNQFMEHIESEISSMDFDEDICSLELNQNEISVTIDSGYLANEIVVHMPDVDEDELSDMIDRVYKEVK